MIKVFFLFLLTFINCVLKYIHKIMIFIWLNAYIVDCCKHTDALNVYTNNDNYSPRLGKCMALETVVVVCISISMDPKRL